MTNCQLILIGFMVELLLVIINAYTWLYIAVIG